MPRVRSLCVTCGIVPRGITMPRVSVTIRYT